MPDAIDFDLTAWKDRIFELEDELLAANAAIRWMDRQILRNIDIPTYPGYERNKVAIERALKGTKS